MRVLVATTIALLAATALAFAGDDDDGSRRPTVGGVSSDSWTQRRSEVDTGGALGWRAQRDSVGSSRQHSSSEVAEPGAVRGKGEYLGNLSANPFDPNSTANPFGAGSPYRPDGVRNSFGTYGSPYSSKSATNPHATDAPKLYDSEGNYRGKLSANPYDPDSTSNPYGRYGSQFSPESINNPYGAGSPYRSDSPANSFGNGLEIYGE